MHHTGTSCESSDEIKMKLKSAITLRKRRQNEKEEDDVKKQRIIPEVMKPAPATTLDSMTSFERRRMRENVLNLSINKMSQIQDPESNLLRTVLLSNSINLARAHMQQDYLLQRKIQFEQRCLQQFSHEAMECQDADDSDDSDDDDDSDYDGDFDFSSDI